MNFRSRVHRFSLLRKRRFEGDRCRDERRPPAAWGLMEPHVCHLIRFTRKTSRIFFSPAVVTFTAEFHQPKSPSNDRPSAKKKKNREWGTEEKISNEIVINVNYRIQGAWATIFFFNSWVMFLFEKK